MDRARRGTASALCLGLLAAHAASGAFSPAGAASRSGQPARSQSIAPFDDTSAVKAAGRAPRRPRAAAASSADAPQIPSAQRERRAEPDPGGAAAAAGEAAREPAPGKPLTLQLRARDGYQFSADYYAPAEGAGGRAILLIPEFGETRERRAELASLLSGRGYPVLCMDATGHRRNVTAGPGGLPTFQRMDVRSLRVMLQDVAAAVEALQRQSGAAGEMVIVGLGVSANLGLLYAGEAAPIGALAMVLPGSDCEELDPQEALGKMGAKPVLLIEAEKVTPTDMSRAFARASAQGTSPSRKHIVLDADDAPRRAEHPFGEGELLNWLAEHFPPTGP